MQTPVKHIVHFDLDSFFVAVEILLDPSLKGKPVIVGGSAERGVVSTCSYEARKFGVHSAMPMRKAMQLCPQAIVLRGQGSEYSKYSRWVTDIIAEKVPLFEKASIDEFYCDLTGMDKFFGVTKYTQDLRNTIIKETGLPISCGLSTAKFISKIATNEAKPNGFLQVPAGKEKEFLWPLSVDKINGVGAQTSITLKKMNLFTMKDIALTPVEVLESKIGSWGRSLWNKANGIGSAEIVTDWDQKSMSRENTFHENLTNMEELYSQLVRLTEKVAYDLRSDEKLSGCIAVKIRYNDFETITRQETISYTSLDDLLIKKAKDIFTRAYEKGRPIRLLGVRLSQLIPFTIQMELFNNNAQKLSLYKAVDDIKDKFGSKAVKKAVTVKNKPKEK